MRVLSIAFAMARVADDAVGGAEHVLAHLDQALVAAGHESCVVAAEGSRVCGTLFGTPPAPALLAGDYYQFRYEHHQRQIAHALRNRHFDLVHMHGFDFHEFIPECDAPILATLHLPPSWYPQWIFDHGPRNLRLNCVSASQRKAAPDSPALAPTIPNGVAIPPLAVVPPQRRRGAVMLGRICPEKSFHLGIAAARMAGVNLTLAGKVFGFPEHLAYHDREILPALGDRVQLVGPLGSAEKWELLRHARCLLLPSLVAETSSLVAMEAAACGTPVVAFRSGALPEIVVHGRTGFLVDSVEEMAEAIALAEGISPDTCRAAAIERFDARRMASQYFDLYRRLCEGVASPAAAASLSHSG